MLLPDPRERPWLTVAEVAVITGEGEKVIRSALDAGQLPLLEIGRYHRIPTAAVWSLVGLDFRDFLDRPHAGARNTPNTSDASPGTGLATATATDPEVSRISDAMVTTRSRAVNH